MLGYVCLHFLPINSCKVIEYINKEIIPQLNLIFTYQSQYFKKKESEILQELTLYSQTCSIVITNMYVTLHDPVDTLSTFTNVGNLILTRCHEDTVIYFIQVQLIYNVVLVSCAQQSDLVIYIYICAYMCVNIYIYMYILFSDSFPLQVITKYSSLVLCGRSLLFTYFIYNSMYMLIPNS